MIGPIDHLIGKNTVAFRCIPLQLGLAHGVNRINQLALGKERKTSHLVNWTQRIIMNTIEPHWIDLELSEILTLLKEREIHINTLFDSTFVPYSNQSDRFIGGKTLEIYLPTHGLLDFVDDLDMEWGKWKHLNTLKLLYVDSKELPVEWFDQVKYISDPPSLAIFAVSGVALVLQYMVYAKKFKVDIQEDSCADFCYKCIIPNLRHDLIENWTLGIISAKLKGEPIFYPVAQTVSLGAIKKYEVELDYRINGFMKLGFKLDDLLNITWVRGRSVVQIAKERLQKYQVSTKARHQAFGDLMNKHVDDIFIWMVTHGSGVVKSTVLKEQTRRRFTLSRNKKPERLIKIPYVKLFYSIHIDEYSDWLEGS
jgi:uncharacterized protein YifN (PemK superfamily)